MSISDEKIDHISIDAGILLDECLQSLMGPRFLNNLAADLDGDRLARPAVTLKALLECAVRHWEDGASRTPADATASLWKAIETLSAAAHPADDLVSMEGPELELPETCIRFYEDEAANTYLFRLIPDPSPVGRSGLALRNAVIDTYGRAGGRATPPRRSRSVRIRTAERPFAFATLLTDDIVNAIKHGAHTGDASRLCGLLGLGHFQPTRAILGVQYPSSEVTDSRGVSPTSLDGSGNPDCYFVVTEIRPRLFNRAVDLPDCVPGAQEFVHADSPLPDAFESVFVGTLELSLRPSESVFNSTFPVQWTERHRRTVLEYISS